jgi:hypothetical protein
MKKSKSWEATSCARQTPFSWLKTVKPGAIFRTRRADIPHGRDTPLSDGNFLIQDPLRRSRPDHGYVLCFRLAEKCSVVLHRLNSWNISRTNLFRPRILHDCSELRGEVPSCQRLTHFSRLKTVKLGLPLFAPRGRISHMVVSSPLSGNRFFIQDPWAGGSNYIVDAGWISKYVNGAVFR